MAPDSQRRSAFAPGSFAALAMKTSEHLWVGEFDDGEVVVYSAGELRADEPEWVHLWSFANASHGGIRKKHCQKGHPENRRRKQSGRSAGEIHGVGY